MYEKSPNQGEKLPFPRGVTASLDRTNQLLQIPEEVDLQSFGFFVPWAKKDGVTWKEVSAPDEVFEAFGITSAGIEQAETDVLWGDPIPYLGVLTRGLPDVVALAEAFEGTGYEPVETWATFSGADSKRVPDAVYLHWIAATDDVPHKSVEQAAKEVRGALAFVQRQPPGDVRVAAMPFISAQNMDFNEVFTDVPIENTLVVTSAGETPAMTSVKKNWVVPVALGAVVLGVLWFATRENHVR